MVEPINVDELLASQGSAASPLTVTIDRVVGDDDRVRVTPFLSDSDCLCAKSLLVRKHSIASIASTGETHACCGRRLKVVDVTFADDILTEVFFQLLASEGVMRSWKARVRTTP